LIQRKVGEPKSVESGLKDQVDGVENELPVHVDSRRATLRSRPAAVYREIGTGDLCGEREQSPFDRDKFFCRLGCEQDVLDHRSSLMLCAFIVSGICFSTKVQT
jgi:hypothetical protein